MPSISCSALEQIAPAAMLRSPVAIAVAVDRLTQQRDFRAALVGQLARFGHESASGGRLCSGPRTLGTMQ